MQSLAAVFLGQIVVTAAGAYISVKEYGAEGCGDLKQEGVYHESWVTLMFGSALGVCEPGAGTQKVSCKNGFVALDEYSNVTCEDVYLVEARSKVYDCAERHGRWYKLTCNPDLTGTFKVTFDRYSSRDHPDGTNDCSHDPWMTIEQAFEPGRCMSMAKRQGDGMSTPVTWTPASEKLSRSGDTSTVETFSTMDCTGEVAETEEYTCGTCKTRSASSSWFITCEGSSTTEDPSVSRAFQPAQPYGILSALFVSVGAALRA